MPRLGLTHTYSIKTNHYKKKSPKIDIALQGKTIFDEQIIEINNLFLTAGFHTILVNDFSTGRALISTFLASLNYYHQVGCLTIDNQPLMDADNLYRMLKDNYQNNNDLDQFFMESFYYDFIWIEENESLDHISTLFKTKMKEFGIDQNIPIISLLYKIKPKCR